MKNAVILHGRPKKSEYYDPNIPSMSNAHWLPWLQNQLLIHGVAAQTPEIPLSYEPVWERWVREVERFDISPDTTLVGHSCGGGFWLRYLSERPDLRVGRVVLVAPWIDVEKQDPNHFFDFELDQYVVGRTERLTIFHSDKDAPEIESSLVALQDKLRGAAFREFPGYGHFFAKHMKTETFPELLDELVG